MRIWAIADLHLSFGVPNKNMDVFGPAWHAHTTRIETAWRHLIAPEDLVLIPGDISWAMKFEDALPDLQWIDQLPGTKLLLKGNHDYWWGSLAKMVPALPPSIHLLQNNCFFWKGVAVGGSRLWDSPEYSFSSLIDFRENIREKKEVVDHAVQQDLNKKVFERELQRLEMSLSKMPPEAQVRIAMTHYPPIGADLAPSRAAEILERHRIQICVFGHLHNIRAGENPFGEKRGIRYLLTSADYVHFEPVPLLSTP